MTDADVALAVWEAKWKRFKSKALPKAAANAEECLEASKVSPNGGHPMLCLIRRNKKTLKADELAATNKLMVDIFGESH